MKKILGLDLGTNSIGWALVDKEEHKIIGMGSRVIPMGAELSKFEQGQAQTKNANRRIERGIRKANKRYKQRRNKLIYILQQLNMLPDQIVLTEPFTDPNRIDKICIEPIDKNQKQFSAFDLVDLRVKALTEEVSLKELGRIIYLFNQLRGYSGGNAEPEKEINQDDESDEKKARRESFVVFSKIIAVSEPTEIQYKGKQIKKRTITIQIDDDRIEQNVIEADTFLEILKEGESMELSINITNTKSGISFFIKLPNVSSWRKKMENLEKELNDKSKAQGREVYLSEHFLEILKENRWAKIRNNVVLRSRFESEFDAIWDTQYIKNSEFKKIVDNNVLLEKLVYFIFPNRVEGKAESEMSKNSRKGEFRKQALEKGLKYLVKKQIIYYQRELKDQSDLISNCRFEPTEKVVPKSHPNFQEFRIWEQINKLSINTKVENGFNRKGEKRYIYVDKPIPSELKEWIYEELQTKKEVTFKSILNRLIRSFNFIEGTDFLNGLDHKAAIKGNDTILLFKKQLKEHWSALNLEIRARQIELWDILYNGKGNEYDLESDRTSKVLSFFKRNLSDDGNINSVAIQIAKIKFSRNYSSMSLVAIEKIMPLVKAGKYFDGNFSDELYHKIVKLVNETVTDPFEKAAQEYLERNVEMLRDGGIVNAFATILVYGRHTDKSISESDLVSDYRQIKRLKQGELRNPLAEQIINETIVLVKNIWEKYGERPSEIRIELARELKNSADKRKKIYKSQLTNQKENERIKERLQDLKEELSLANIEKYKLWMSQENLQDEYVKNYRDSSKSEIQKVKLWEEQGHVSPYTGKPISLLDLFNKGKYDVDHIIPKSRYFDDSFTNKVICETAVNKEKGNRTAMEYFESGSLTQSILSKEVFIAEVNRMFFGAKRNNLLATKIPDDPIQRQIKDTQYIAVRTKEELVKIVGSENVKSTTGGVTDYLRNQWGLTDKFKRILKTRYEDIISNEKYLDSEYTNYLKGVQSKQEEYLEIGKDFNDVVLDKDRFVELLKLKSIQIKNNKLILKDWSKRIDHRHHAIDALVVACTEQSHIQRLNNLNKELQDWLQENRKTLLPDFQGSPSELIEEVMNLDENKRLEITKQLKRFTEIPMPWTGFDFDAEAEIENVIVSQKPKDKLIIQTDTNGKPQIKIRGQLHEGTLYGKSQSLESYRIPLTKLAVKTFATEKAIEKIVNPQVKALVAEHLRNSKNKEEAFSAEGIMEFNKKIEPHTPISKVKIFYKDPAKKKIGKKSEVDENDTLQKLDRQKSFNNSLYVKTGDNYLFAVLAKEEIDKKTQEVKVKRVFDIITFFDATSLLKMEFNKSIDKKVFNKDLVFKKHFEDKNRSKLLFTLKQGDYVYLPSANEDVIFDQSSPFYNQYWNDKKSRSSNIYIVQKYSGNEIYFIKHNIAKSIKKGLEFGSQDCYQKINNISIKDNCIKIELDRLGNVINVIR